MLEIKEVCSEEYRHKQMYFAYETKGYYDLKVDGFHYQFVYTPFETAQTRGFDDELLSDWLENGFKIIVFDTHAFSNQDIQNHEIEWKWGRY